MNNEETEFVDVELPGKDAFNLMMASKTLDEWFKRNPTLVKSRDTERILHARHLLRDFAMFYKASLLQRDSILLPDELGVLNSFLQPNAAVYVICNMASIDSSIENPTGGMGYVWTYLDEYGQPVGDPVACGDGIPSGPYLTEEIHKGRRDVAWLFTLPPKPIQIEEIR